MAAKKIDLGLYWLIGLIVLIILVIVFYNIGRNLGPEKYNYQGKNGEFFIDKETISNINIYYTHVFVDGQEYIYPFRNHPEDLEGVYLEEGLQSKLNRPKGTKFLYVTRDFNLGENTKNQDVIAAAGFEQILGTGKVGLYRVNLLNTYTTKHGDDTPEIKCSDVDEDTAVIYLRLASETKVYSEGDCVVIQGEDAKDLIKAGEKFGYYLLGVF